MSFRRIARIVRLIEEAGADRLGCGGAAERGALESSHGVNGGASSLERTKNVADLAFYKERAIALK